MSESFFKTFIKSEAPTLLFSCKFYEIFIDNCFVEHLRRVASVFFFFY